MLVGGVSGNNPSEQVGRAAKARGAKNRFRLLQVIVADENTRRALQSVLASQARASIVGSYQLLRSDRSKGALSL